MTNPNNRNNSMNQQPMNQPMMNNTMNQQPMNQPMMNNTMNQQPMNQRMMNNTINQQPMNNNGYRAPENRFERKNKYTGEAHQPTHINTSVMYGQKQGGTLEFSAVPNHGLDPNSRPLGDQTMVISNAAPNPYMQQQTQPKQEVVTTTTATPVVAKKTPKTTTTFVAKQPQQQIVAIEQTPRQRASVGAIVGGVIGIIIALGLIVIGVLLIVGIITI